MGGETEEAHRGYRDSYTRPSLPLEGRAKRGGIPPKTRARERDKKLHNKAFTS